MCARDTKSTHTPLTPAGLQVVGQTLSLGYYAVPFRRPPAGNATAGEEPANAIVEGLNQLVSQVGHRRCDAAL